MAHSIVVADTSVLINFLKIDAMSLIGRFPGRLLATDHVEAEIASDYPEQQARYAAALKAGSLDSCTVTDPVEVSAFLSLYPGVHLGAGECSAIAVALTRGHAIAIHDKRAIRAAERAAEIAGVVLAVLRTRDIIVLLIRAGVLAVEQADAIKKDWEEQHRFRLAVRSFGDLL